MPDGTQMDLLRVPVAVPALFFCPNALCRFWGPLAQRRGCHQLCGGVALSSEVVTMGATFLSPTTQVESPLGNSPMLTNTATCLPTLALHQDIASSLGPCLETEGPAFLPPEEPVSEDDT